MSGFVVAIRPKHQDVHGNINNNNNNNNKDIYNAQIRRGSKCY